MGEQAARRLRATSTIHEVEFGEKDGIKNKQEVQGEKLVGGALSRRVPLWEPKV